MTQTGHIQRVADDVIVRQATMKDLWRAISVNTPAPCHDLCIIPDEDNPNAIVPQSGPLVRIVGADAKLVERIHRHARNGGNFYDLKGI